MDYEEIKIEDYYRKGVFRHFSEDCKCSTSVTSKISVKKLVEYSASKGTKFYINFLYILSSVLNSRADYRLFYDYKQDKLFRLAKISPAHYIFHDDTETCTVVYTEFDENYRAFYKRCAADIAAAKLTREYGLDSANHLDYFDASYISWISYESLNIELPDGYLYFMPIVNWGRYKREGEDILMPVSVRLNHAAADGYLVAKVFKLLEEKIDDFCRDKK